MVIPVIKYIIDCISATFVGLKCLFSFCSLFCFCVYGLTDGIPKSLSLQVHQFTANWLSCQILVRQHKATRYFRGRFSQLFGIDASSWGTKVDFGIIYCLSDLFFEKLVLGSRYLVKGYIKE